MAFGARVADINTIIFRKEGSPELPPLPTELKGLKDGEHVVAHDKEYGKLVAHMEGGKVVEWTAFNKQGEQIPTVVIQNPPIASPDVPVRVCVCMCYAGTDDVCWYITVERPPKK